MKYIFSLSLVFLFGFTLFLEAQTVTIHYPSDIEAENEQVAYYDLRDRSTYIQVSNDDEFSFCIHVQIFQQDKGCTELDFYDELTANDTHVYNLDDIIRNNGSSVPINLDEDSYGFVGISSFDCVRGINSDHPPSEALIGNFRIIDNSGYEYRTNLISEDGDVLTDETGVVQQNVIINFNLIDGVNRSDIVGFVYDENRNTNNVTQDDLIINISTGVTFNVFQIDENEERLSCDTVNFACGAEKTMYYGINEDLPSSKGSELLCEGAGLVAGQTSGYISLENATAGTNNLNIDNTLEFVCLVGLNNGNGTGSMETCQYRPVSQNQ